jgi:putative methyltransferase (TIGR04325 family)
VGYDLLFLTAEAQRAQRVVFMLKTVLNKILTKLPIVSDYYRYYWSFPRTITACRGVYSSFAEAARDIPPGAKVGYNQPEIRLAPSVAKLTAAFEADEFNPTDYPVLVWLAAAFTNSSRIFDLGGNVGQAYYTYQKFLQYPQSLHWIVCDLPEVIKAGDKLASTADNPGLSFTENFTDADGAEIFLTCGTLQYIETPLAQMLGQLKTKPQHLSINRVPFYEGKQFITLQNIGYAICPYKIQNRTEFIDSLTAIGYKLIDSWKWDRTCHIPFHPARFIPNYCGFYFRLER